MNVLFLLIAFICVLLAFQFLIGRDFLTYSFYFSQSSFFPAILILINVAIVIGLMDYQTVWDSYTFCCKRE